MKRAICIVGISAFLAGTANGALLYLENAADGSTSMDLAPGESGELSVIMYVHDIDSDGVACAIGFLDTDDEVLAESVPVTEILDGDWYELDFPKDELPATLEEFGFGGGTDP